MSSHSRLACAACALALFIVPSSALADSGGVAYGSSAGAQKNVKLPKGHAARHLGDRVPVRRGMKGHDVKILQDFLGRLGIGVGVDGSFGRQTLVAVREFEQRMKLPVDGVLDAADLAALQRVIAHGGFPPPPQPAPLPAGSRAKVAANGLAAVPVDAPQVVKDIIAAGNRIASMPYHYGGGHGRWKDTGYDCSGSVSFALHGAGLLKVSRDSTGFEHFGQAGPGRWVTIYANGGHAWMIVAGLRFDTSGLSSAGSRWQQAKRTTAGYVVRHPVGL